MGKFKIVKRLGLDFLGSEWKECFLSFTAVTFAETELLARAGVNKKETALSKAAMKLLEDHFVSGEAIGEDGKKRPVSKEELADFPPDVIVKALQLLAGETGPNA